MTGHVFHPGHHELHGITVVLETNQAQIYIGRFDKQDESGVHMIGVSLFDPAQAGLTRDEFVARTVKFGVKVDRPHLVIPSSLVREITPLNSIRNT